MRKWNIHERHVALKTKPTPLQRPRRRPLTESISLDLTKRDTLKHPAKRGSGTQEFRLEMTEVPTGMETAAAGLKQKQPDNINISL